MESHPDGGLVAELQAVHDSGTIPCEAKKIGDVVGPGGLLPVNFPIMGGHAMSSPSIAGRSALEGLLFVIKIPSASPEKLPCGCSGSLSGGVDPVHCGRHSRQCVVCKKSFFNHGSLVRHMIIHTEERPFGCTFEGCTRTFNRRDTSSRHYFTHFQTTVHKCSICSNRFSRADNLKRHLKEKHSGS